jgi:hypothetical protein
MNTPYCTTLDSTNLFTFNIISLINIGIKHPLHLKSGQSLL